jgi:hypothetical protein
MHQFLSTNLVRSVFHREAAGYTVSDVLFELNLGGLTNTHAVNTPNAVCDPVISNICHSLIFRGIRSFGAARGARAPSVTALTARTAMARPRDSIRRRQGNRTATQTRLRKHTHAESAATIKPYRSALFIPFLLFRCPRKILSPAAAQAGGTASRADLPPPKR